MRPGKAGLGGVEEQADHCSDDDQVEQHLDAHHDPGQVGLRRAVAESDRGEDRNGEIQRPGVVKLLPQRGSGTSCQRPLLRVIPLAAQPAAGRRLDEQRHVLLPVRGAENG